jgi:c-di-GMP-binding flagellar brake protein YcgR
MIKTVERKTLASERRRHPRYLVKERSLVEVTGDQFGLPYHLVDISEGGMAFRYLNSSQLSLTGSQMDIYLNNDLQVGRLPVTVVADRQLADDFIPKRHCCVRFGNLTPAQQIQLRDFIRCQTKSVQSSS